jgi:hypothetical protein
MKSYQLNQIMLLWGIAPVVGLSSSTTTCPDSSLTHLNVSLLRERIAEGRVYQQPNFFSQQQIDDILAEIVQLKQDGVFAPSGLSNTARGAQQAFGSQDRSVCVVPWWSEMLLQNNNTVSPVSMLLQQLRLQLADVLDRPTMSDPTLAHECYYSWSGKGSFLPRHMDERHEELKGPKGWLLPSRRSLSWLVYLSDENWTLEQNGGALRSFPQQTPPQQPAQHDGNLQVGWLLRQRKAVYLNSWFLLSGSNEPHCILYTVEGNELRYLTRPWLAESLQGTSVAEFLNRMRDQDSSGLQTLFLDPDDARDFALLENRSAWDRGELPEGSIIEDICPTRGFLVVFDSVMLPHQVEVIKEGNRIALAGWFHEQTQEFPVDLFAQT